MTDCKKVIISMIDEAIERNGRESGCTCQYDIGKTPMCAYCANKEALRVARACIVSSVDRVDAMFTLMRTMQGETEEKLNREVWG